jgi:hypothetical protein
LVGVIEKTKRIVETERRLCTELTLKGIECRGRLDHGGGRECGSRANEGSEKDALHCWNDE